MRELIVLGTGSAMVTHCFNTCFALHLDNEYFLVDAGGGNGILRQLEQAKIDARQIHHLFVTHGHTDHVLGVIWVIRKIATLINQGKYEGIFTIYCHRELIETIETMTRLTLKKTDVAQLGQRIVFKEVKDGQQCQVLSLKLTFFDIQSTKAKQFGFTAKFPEGLLFSCLGDEPFNEHCREYVTGSDWLLSEAFCLYADREVFKPYEKHHSTVKEAGEIAAALNVKNLVLYHTEDKNMAGRKKNYTQEAKEYYRGNIYVPDDLEVINLDGLFAAG
ncbi:MAG: MBL fold metallo-hydrolase [Selenomonadaceae bacterium]